MTTKHKNITFGAYLRRLREKQGISLRKLAKKLAISAPYLNDIEKDKRSAPNKQLIKKLSLILKANLNLLYDLAGDSKKTIPPDIEEYIKSNSDIASLIRAAKSSKISNEEIQILEKKISKKK